MCFFWPNFVYLPPIVSGTDQNTSRGVTAFLLSDKEWETFLARALRREVCERGLRVSHYLRNMGCIRDS